MRVGFAFADPLSVAHLISFAGFGIYRDSLMLSR
jgi:hypothetical protein